VACKKGETYLPTESRFFNSYEWEKKVTEAKRAFHSEIQAKCFGLID
jgi:hypothetical protein